jgi:hypothetical protein
VELSILPRALLALLLSAVPISARANQMILTCTNPSNGTTWDLKVDFDRRAVESFPADISDQSISWEDTLVRRFYEFDRASGDLTMHTASSTGGFFFNYHCRARQ